MDDAPKLFEVGETWGAHPHDKMLRLGVDPLGRRAVGATLVFAADVARPGYPAFVDGDAHSVLG